MYKVWIVVVSACRRSLSGEQKTKRIYILPWELEFSWRLLCSGNFISIIFISLTCKAHILSLGGEEVLEGSSLALLLVAKH